MGPTGNNEPINTHLLWAMIDPLLPIIDKPNLEMKNGQHHLEVCQTNFQSVGTLQVCKDSVWGMGVPRTWWFWLMGT